MNFTLDPKTTALVLVDLQHSNVPSQAAPLSSAEVVANAVLLANALRSAGGTVVFTRVLVTELLVLAADVPTASGQPRPPANSSDLVAELEVQPGDVVVTKRQWGAFYGTDLEQQLRRRDIRTLVLGGIATNIGVESTARAAFDMGYELVFAEDALSSISAVAHAFVITTIFPHMGRIRSTQQLLQAWQQTA